MMLATAAPASASSPLAWTPPVRVDTTSPFASPVALAGMSCVGNSFCVATDTNGDVVTSTSPASPPSWTVARADGYATLAGISCLSMTFCIAVDNHGQIVTSQAPTNGASAWLTTRVDASYALNSISCAPKSGPGWMCAAVDAVGDVVTSNDPLGGPTAWSVQAVDSGNILKAVTCPTSSFCAAVDSAGQVLTSGNPGSPSGTWTATPTGIPSGQLTSISCSSTSLCVAVDSAGDVITSTNPNAASPTWTVGSIDATRALQSVSCPADAFCVASDNNGNILTSNNPAGGSSTWSTPPTKIDGTTNIRVVDCTSTTFCIAGDVLGNAFTSTNPGGGATAWSAAEPIDGVNRLPGVACPSSGLCVAAGQLGKVLTSTNPSAATDDWVPQIVDAGHTLTSIACPTVGFCAAVDNAGNVLTTNDPQNGGSAQWTSQPIDPGVSLQSISCPSTGICAAVDTLGNVLTSTDPADTSHTPVWKLQNVDGPTQLNAVSCSSAASCAIADNAGNILTSADPVDTTTTPVWTSHNVDGSRPIVGISCPTDNLCVAVDNAGYAISATSPASANSTWGSTLIDPGQTPVSISCPRETLCIAVDAYGDAVVSTNPTGNSSAWTAQAIDNGSHLLGSSCPSLSFCLAVDSASNALVASPASTPANLTVTTSTEGYPAPSGSTPGTVTGAGINCPLVECTNRYVGGTVVTLTATPNSNFIFNGWTGACSGTGSCQVLMNGDQAVGASFVPVYTLSIALGGTGTGQIAGSGISCPGTCSSTFPAGTTVTLSAIPNAGSKFSGWSYGACSGSSSCQILVNSNRTVTANFATAPPPPTHTAPPVNVKLPQIVGTMLPGHTLSCANGTWTNSPTYFSYAWSRNGALLKTVKGQTVFVRNLDEGAQFVCTVTASNPAGHGFSATSPGAIIAMAGTLRCPRPTGTLAGRYIGPIALGYSRGRVRHVLGKRGVTYNLFDDFCLYGGWGIRVGYPSLQLFHRLTPADRKKVAQRAIIALTANAHYALDGIRPGSSILPAIRFFHLHLRNRLRLGANTWWFVPGRYATGVLKVRHGVIEEVGVATRWLTLTHAAQRNFMLSFPRAFY